MNHLKLFKESALFRSLLNVTVRAFQVFAINTNMKSSLF